MGAFAGDVAVGKELAGLFVVELFGFLLHKFTLVIEFAEKVGSGLAMGFRGGAAIDIEGDAETLEGILDDIMVTVHDILGCDALVAGLYGDGHTVLVAATDEKHLLATEAEIAGVDVSGDINAGEMADMHGTIGVRQRRGDQSPFEFLILIHIRSEF